MSEVPSQVDQIVGARLEGVRGAGAQGLPMAPQVDESETPLRAALTESLGEAAQVVSRAQYAVQKQAEMGSALCADYAVSQDHVSPPGCARWRPLLR